MNPGELRHKITIQQFILTKNTNGFEIMTWVDYKKLWVSKRSLGGKEYYSAAAVKAETDVAFGGRFVKGITPQMRIVEGTQIYNVKSALDSDGKRKTLNIVASEVVKGV